MPAYEEYINESRAIQHRDDLIREASAERMLRAMRNEMRAEAKPAERAAAIPATSGARQALHSMISELAAIIEAAIHHLGSGPRTGHTGPRAGHAPAR